jgi:hypothetical protein
VRENRSLVKSKMESMACDALFLLLVLSYGLILPFYVKA